MKQILSLTSKAYIVNQNDSTYVFVGFYMDPAVSDACLHLTAIPCKSSDTSQGVPVSCGSFLPPRSTSSQFPEGKVNAIQGNMQYSGQGKGCLQIGNLVSKQIAEKNLPSNTSSDVKQVKSKFFLWDYMKK